MRSNKGLSYLVAATMALGCVVAQAEDSSSVIRLKAGASQNDFDTIWSGGDLKTDYVSTNIGLTFIAGNGIFIGADLKSSNSAKWNTLALLPNEPGEIVNDGQDERYEREDITLTIGKSFSNGWQIFGGYQHSDSDIQLPDAAAITLGWVEKETFEIEGYFLGVGKSFQVGNGSINLNAAYGVMKGTLSDAIAERFSSGNDSGYSLGASYTYYFSDHFGVSLEVKNQSYTYKYSADAPVTSGDDDMTAYGLSFVLQTDF